MMSELLNTTIFNTFPNLESNRLLYRAFKENDTSNLLDIRTNNDVTRYMDVIGPKTNQDALDRIISIQKAFKEQTGITWAIIDKSTNHLIGDFGIWRLDKKNSRGEIGYVLHPDFWGKGFMKETMNTILPFAFNDLKLHSLEANVNPKNDNSKHLLLKLGFKQEAYFRENYFYDGQFLDSVIYSLLKSDTEN